ncbi:hypothetical protein INS49_010701 [Diaporthe citri]|uniref:uncharacterized protein n=1 Tax=Diaporthe citri TaxID=83186 RepID=UPI001C81CE62|nr:uncharacterized protein INS49_010701 [Diaporthe citri]KAG6362471.1 hypothetical protein INS49_010701 [Diaporthe citri]
MANKETSSPEEAIQVQSHIHESPEHSEFSHGQKNCIIGLAAFAGWFSSVSSFIYFPAIPAIANDLDESIERINLTVTSYLIVSGIFPSITGNEADRFGRRPVFLTALTVYLLSNTGLALQSNFGLLFFLRMVQSAGISGTFSVTYGVLSDLFTPAERGGYAGVISFFLNTPPSIGPLLSGLLLLRWSWRSIFWFLSAATPCCLIPIALFLPETNRAIVGNGSVRARGINRPLLPLLVPNVAVKSVDGQAPDQEKTRARASMNPFTSIKLLRSPGNVFMMSAYGVGYATYSCLQASLSSLFLDIYEISGLTSGLIYIPFGVACALSAFATGKLLDRNFRKTATELGVPVTRNKADNLSTFPVEKARLRTIVPLISLSACLITAYGWQLQTGVVMAGPLVTQFFIGLTIQTMFTALSTLLVDANQECPSTAQAACNLVRCEMAAGYLAALDPLLRAIGPGWTFLLLAGVLLLSVIMLLALQCKGLHWRQKRSGAKPIQGPKGRMVAVDDQRELDTSEVENNPIGMQTGTKSQPS